MSARDVGGPSWRSSRWRGWALVVVWAGVILTVSGDTFSAAQTGGWLAWAMTLLWPSASDAQVMVVHVVLRKTAHVLEYALLGVLTVDARRADGFSPRPRPLAVAVIVVIGCALLDESRQALLASRTGSPFDVGLDTLGGLTGSAARLAWHDRRARTNGQNAAHA